jgi:hypothetical protein
MMNETKRSSELQVVVRFLRCAAKVICSFNSTCIGETGVALRKADICVFCKLKGPKMYFLFGIYWPQHVGELSYCNLGNYSCTFCIYSKRSFN